MKIYHIGEHTVDIAFEGGPDFTLPPMRVEEIEMTKYFIESKTEDFIIDVPADAQVVVDNIYNNDSASGELRVVRREVVINSGPDWSNVQYNDHVLARYEGVVACRSEEVTRQDPEVA